jgi:putative integral membrane protein (TIGR02587 family)
VISTDEAARARRPSRRELLLGLGRAFGGSLLFAVPMLMTMELWEFGATLSRLRLAGLTVFTVALTIGLARYLGFRDTPGDTWGDHVADGLVAFGVGVVTAVAVLAVFGLFAERSLREVAGIVAIESVATAVGAAIARSQLTSTPPEVAGESSGYGGELFLMAVGATVFATNIAPTQEVVLIATQLGPVGGVGLALLSVAVMHALVYLVGFRGQHRSEASGPSIFVGYSLAGYAVALVVALAMLWVFGRTDGVALQFVARQTVVLAFPGALGAAVARLVL